MSGNIALPLARMGAAMECAMTAGSMVPDKALVGGLQLQTARIATAAKA